MTYNQNRNELQIQPRVDAEFRCMSCAIEAGMLILQVLFIKAKQL